MKLVVIGPTQSGKTCLAVGLSCTIYGKTLFRRAFTANAGGDESRSHLLKFRKMLESEKWPDGTTDTKTLDFDFEWKRKTIKFSFNDYKGENSIEPAFLKKISELGADDGVVLLVNPGFNFPCVREQDGAIRFATDLEVASSDKPAGFFVLSAFEDSPLARKWLVDQEGIYQKLIENLKTRNGEQKKGKPVVAVTVTASDRIGRQGDLLSIRPQFDEFLSRITSMLETSGFDWRPFKVSVTGVLADQTKPKLGRGLANTSAKPFFWVLRRLWWRSVRDKWVSAARWAAGIAIAAGICFGAYEWVVAGNADKGILSLVSECNALLGKKPFGIVELKKSRDIVRDLRDSGKWRFHSRKAGEYADTFEPGIWTRQKRLIKGKIIEFSESGGKLGSDPDINSVEQDLFDPFKPTLPGILDDYNALRREWDDQKPKFKNRHAEYVFREEVEKKLRESENVHGLPAMDELYPLADIIEGQLPVTERLLAIKIDLAKKLDERVEMEWREVAIPDFARCASTNATHEAVREFQMRLDDWSCVTVEGEDAKSNLAHSVATNALVWRMDYAVNCRTLEALAELYPERVATNEFLTSEFVLDQWESRGKLAFDKARKEYLDCLVSKIKNRSGRPTLTEDGQEKEEIERKATSVGAPFDGPAAWSYVAKQVGDMGKDWEANKRRGCYSWVEENIRKRPGRERTGRDGIWDAYIAERRNHSYDEDIFDEIVRKQVYQWAEKCLEEDVAFFCSQKETVAEKEKLFVDKFKPLCKRIKEDARHQDPASWAYPFAVKCIDIGKINDNFANAFPQSFEVTKVLGRIQYDGNDPWEYGFKGVQIGLSAVVKGPLLSIPITPIVPRKHSDATLISERKRHGDWKRLLSVSVKVQGSLALPVSLFMEVEDRRSRDSNQNGTFYMPLYLPDKDGCGNGVLEFGGQFGTKTDDRTMAAYCSVSVRRISGKGVLELLSEAKDEAAEESAR